MINITAIQTGTVSIRPHHLCGEEGRGPVRRKIDMLLDRKWVEDLPIYCYVIEHPEGVFVVDTGDTAETSRRDYLPAWHPFFRHGVEVRVAPEEEIGVQLAARGIDVRKDVTAVILTHLHHDHAGGLHHFPHNRILVTGENHRLAAGLRGKIFGCLPQHWPTWFRPTLIDFTDEGFGPFPRAHRVTRDGRVLLVPTPGHMRGHASVVVRTGDVTYFMAGDATYDQDLLLEELVDGVTYDVAASKQTLCDIRTLGRAEPTILLPAHDRRALHRLENDLVMPTHVAA